MSAPSQGVEQDVAQSSVSYNNRPGANNSSSADGVIWNDGSGNAGTTGNGSDNGSASASSADEQKSLLTGGE
ncbi:hypothetical protein PC115_g25384 [Phytophthora cactorum]|uniref:Uncharacterized protein n=2 Tax=cellular organisms TaxID=131567 RepID=A0A8T1A4D4_9STRA|nr:hypothetical protein PC115_g25384 [Phytophthora cactorum]